MTKDEHQDNGTQITAAAAPMIFFLDFASFIVITVSPFQYFSHTPLHFPRFLPIICSRTCSSWGVIPAKMIFSHWSMMSFSELAASFPFSDRQTSFFALILRVNLPSDVSPLLHGSQYLGCLVFINSGQAGNGLLIAVSAVAYDQKHDSLGKGKAAGPEFNAQKPSFALFYHGGYFLYGTHLLAGAAADTVRKYLLRLSYVFHNCCV